MATTLFIVAFGATVAARADSAPLGPEALKLFEDGRKAAADGRWTEACDAFSRSNAIDARVGTLLNLGDCEEHRQRLASAWVAFSQAKLLATKNSDPRVTEAERRLIALDGRVSYIKLIAPKVPKLTVTKNGQAIPLVALDGELPIDGGDHLFAATAPGYKPWSMRVQITSEGSHATIALELARDPNATPDPGEPGLVATPRRRGWALGAVLGASTRERYQVGVLTSNMFAAITGAVQLRASAIAMYSRFRDPDTEMLFSTFYGNVAIDAVWRALPTVSVGGGFYIGIEHDREPTVKETSGAFGVRATPLLLHLFEGRGEFDFTTQLTFAGSEVTLYLLAGFAWVL